MYRMNDFGISWQLLRTILILKNKFKKLTMEHLSYFNNLTVVKKHKIKERD